MKKVVFIFSIISLLVLCTILSCKKDQETEMVKPAITEKDKSDFNVKTIESFFETHPLLKKYEDDVKKLYQKHQYRYIWFNKGGINEFASLLYDKINNIDEEGIQTKVPYKDKLAELYNSSENNIIPNIEVELLNSSLYFFYAMNVYHGLDTNKSK